MKRIIFSALFTLVTFPALARETPPIAGQAAPKPAPAAEATNDVPSPELTARDRGHRGFYLRAELGGGYRSLNLSQNDMQVDGGGLGTSLLLGGSPTPNLFIVAELSASMITNPTLRAGSQSVQTDNASASLFGFGPGVVYYLMPANVSFGGSLLLSKASVSEGGTKVGETELGLGGSLRVGKEWWLGSRTGLGINGQLHLASMKDSGEGSGSIFATAFTVAAAFTYN